MLMQNFGATNKEYYGMLWYFLWWTIVLKCWFLLKIATETITKYVITDKYDESMFLHSNRPI